MGLFFGLCRSSNAIVLPTVITETVTSIVGNIAIVGGEVVSEGQDIIIERGVCYSTSSNPTINDGKLAIAGTVGAFSYELTGLLNTTLYYVRAYATNSKGTAYGENATFTTHTTYYIKNTGNNSNSGLSDALAWQTISKVNSSSFSPGDAVLFNKGDTWRDTLIIPSHGTLGNPITFSNYGTGVKPKFLGSNIATDWTDQGNNIWKSNTILANPFFNTTANVFFVNIDLTVGTGVRAASLIDVTSQYNWFWQSNSIYIYSTSDPSSAFNSIEVAQRSVIIDLDFKEYIVVDGIDLFYSGAHGVFVGGEASQDINGLEVRNCEIAYLGYPDGAGYGVFFSYSNSIIENNIIHDHGRRAIAPTLNGNFTMHDITMRYNTFYNGWHTTGIDMEINQGWGAGKIDNVFIYGNLTYEDEFRDTSVMPMGWFIANQSDDPLSTMTNVYIYNNIFKYSTSGVQLYYVNSAFMYNNTFYGHNNVTSHRSSHFYLTASKNLIFRNNLYFSQLSFDRNTPGSENAGVTYYLTTLQDVAEIDSDYNLFYRLTTALNLFDIHSIYTQYDWSQISTVRTNYGWEQNSIFGDPLVVSATDYHLQIGSPAIGAGVDVDIATDRDGVAYSNPPSVGCYEYVE